MPVASPPTSDSRFVVRKATAADRSDIYRIRHQIYAEELGQHPRHPDARLHDDLDPYNDYLVICRNQQIAGFISITPPSSPSYSLDKYLERSRWPVPPCDSLYEARLLTVLPKFRHSPAAALLMHAALRTLQESRADQVVAIGRREVVPLYERGGFRRLGPSFLSGKVCYDLMSADLKNVGDSLRRFRPMLQKLQSRIDWQLPVSFNDADPATPAPTAGSCFHGGAFFDQIGPDFRSLNNRHSVISADVLDAWFPPAPEVLRTLTTHLDWALRTSPPTRCEGLIAEIAATRNLPPDRIAVGSGSSDLIFRTLPAWLDSASRVLLPDPTYGEYQHVLNNLIGCHVDRFALKEHEHYAFRPAALEQQVTTGRYDAVILVNPNNPTGTLLPPHNLKRLLEIAPPSTRFWIDETYIDYYDPSLSMEQTVIAGRNAIVCKSLSKACALSGARVAYLCGPDQLVRPVRHRTPPWVVGLPAQLAAVAALRDPEYYQQRYQQTEQLRTNLTFSLEALGITVLSGMANFLLCRLADSAIDTMTLIHRCRREQLFLRDISSMTGRPDPRLFRIAVKDAPTNQRMIAILARALEGDSASPNNDECPVANP